MGGSVINYVIKKKKKISCRIIIIILSFFLLIMNSDHHKSIFSRYHISDRPDKALPVLKTDKDLEAEELARLSIDLPSFQVTDEKNHCVAESPKEMTEKDPKDYIDTKPKPKFPNINISNRHSVGFDIPGAVHTILTPSKP